MKRNFRPGVLLATGLAFSLILGGICQLVLPPSTLQAQETAPPKTLNAPDTQTEFDSITGKLPDQSHVMTDVAEHFSNLWFAADKQNWPLANYYLGEAREHLRWAVRIHPVRKISTGAEVNLKGILDAVDGGLLAEVGRSITNKDSAKFKASYQQALRGCYSCHLACEKPYLRPQIPTTPAVSIINFDPDATGP